MSFGQRGAVKCGDFFCSFLRKKLTALLAMKSKKKECHKSILLGSFDGITY